MKKRTRFLQLLAIASLLLVFAMLWYMGADACWIFAGQHEASRQPYLTAQIWYFVCGVVFCVSVGVVAARMLLGMRPLPALSWIALAACLCSTMNDLYVLAWNLIFGADDSGFNFSLYQPLIIKICITLTSFCFVLSVIAAVCSFLTKTLAKMLGWITFAIYLVCLLLRCGHNIVSADLFRYFSFNSAANMISIVLVALTNAAAVALPALLLFGDNSKAAASSATGSLPGLFSFSGRARRSSFWLVFVCNNAISILFWAYVALIVTAITNGTFDFSFISQDYFRERGFYFLLNRCAWVFSIGIVATVLSFLWGLSVQVRRFHDLGWSGKSYLLFLLAGFLPVIGWIAIAALWIYTGFVDGQPFPNGYGPDPKGRNQPPEQPPPPRSKPAVAASPVRESRADQLRELKKLLDEGVLTQTEFEGQKAKILAANDIFPSN